MNRSSAVVLILLVACGADDRLGTYRQCSSDYDCAVGQVCAGDGSACINAHGGDLNAWPRPRDSAELLSRFHRMSLASDSATAAGHQSITFGDASAPAVEQDVRTASIQAEVETHAEAPNLVLWDLQLTGSGGALQIWPPTRDGGTFAPIQKLTISLALPVAVALQVGAYPEADASSDATLLVTADIGEDPEHTVAITTRLEHATLSAKFTVVEQRVHLTLRLDANAPVDDAQSWLRARGLALEVQMLGNEVPTTWLDPAR